ncbi:calcineurin-like phosphoesterase, putative [Candida dubliniensis CD36]|uniref:Phosphatase, putative n=1 Tax=Candida dubliniensis (strain CD36 / ATCC MYA-646 / CBS 7987 / NCPF 3949 / NRRL Y-17841) TaxID=573826 RepID=B9WB54_CANDC|nr:calcineurin-like phosphoesterase, putative [Candida dubliniensis CD36]CAX43624.1 calcineurin-like phosphoesterase, putative [Candida dubliniensis CD36]
MLLPKRLLRSLIYLAFFLAVSLFLLLLANKHQIIEINKYIPFDIFGTAAPLFFQPPSDSFIVDISFNNCFKLGFNNKRCGLPDVSKGLLGDKAQWYRLKKDICLGSSWSKRQYLNYKKIKHDEFEKYLSAGKKNKENVVDEVIIDIAVADPVNDVKIKGNEKLKLPKYIIQTFHNVQVYDDDTHASFMEQNNDNRVNAAPVDDKIQAELESDGNKDIESAEENRKEEESKKEQDDERKEAAQEDAKEKGKEADQLKQSSEQNDNDHPKEFEENIKPESPKGDDKKDKREIVTNRNDLNRVLYVPKMDAVLKSGWRYKSNGIWLKYGPHNSKNTVSAIDLLFGYEAVDPRPNWNLIKIPITGVSNPSNLPAYITFRRGPKIDYKKEFETTLAMNSEDKFKILQIADLHFSTGYGKCLDPQPPSSAKGCKADSRTLEFINKVLDLEKPDMVVLTGDQIFGDASPDSESSAFKALNPFVERKIPFAITVGNHDDEGSLKREEIMGIYTDMPYSVAAMGPDSIDGFGNYVVTVQGKSSKSTALSLYFVDSHAYSKTPKITPGYDWIKENQLIYLKQEAESIQDSVEKYRKSNKIPLAMAFFHIPLPEFRNLNQPFIGENREGVTAPRYNSGGRQVLREIGVSVASVGHDHCNDYCLQDTQQSSSSADNKMWLCYGGGAGLGGYGGYNGYIRRMRVYELDTSKGEIKTWKRSEDNPGNVIDEQVLVTNGEVVNW